MSSKKQPSRNSQHSHKSKQSSKQPNQRKENQKRVIHRGVFIADERRKGNNGRIKSTSLTNKIEVRMKRDIVYLHESQVQWVEIARYSKKQGRRQKKEQKKQQKYKLKQGQATKQDIGKGKGFVAKDQHQDKKFKPKQQQELKLQQKASETIDKPSQQTEKIQTDVQNQTQGQIKTEEVKSESNKQQQRVNQPDKQKQRQDADSSSSSSSEDNKQRDKQQKQDIQQQQQENEKQDKKQQDDIVIVAEIKSQLSNPFWKKPFVGVLYFYEKKSKKQEPKYKQKQKGGKSDVSRILDDFDIDIQPIHARLPVCYISKSTAAQKMLEEYVQKNLKFQQSDKGGKRRNMILDQFESTYALVRYVENYRGHIYVDILKIVGKAKTIDGECNCFLYEHELNDFEHQQLKELPKIQINRSPVHKPFDQLVFTIDPLTSVDLDDALSVRKLSQSQYQFGIHISDVSSYLSQVPRQELAKRTTSVYLPHNVFHMLPFYLTQICSLNPQVERVAFSVFVKINTEGQVLDSRLEKNIIKSRYKLAYQQAQGVMDGTLNYQSFNALHSCTKEQFEQLTEKLKIMETVGIKHRKKRLIFQIFDNDEIKFELDEQKWPISFSAKSRITSQKIIQEFMIIGNIETAKKMTAFDSKNSLIIHHPPPSKLAVKQFNQFFEILGMKFKFEDSLSLQKDLMKVSQMQNISQQIKQLCYFKARRVQQTAAYKRFSQVEQTEGNIHFALGLRHYTHFTSPMRRIADIIVHETLNPLVDQNIPKKQLLDKQIEQANWGRKNSKRLKKDLTEIYLCLMIYKTKKQVQAEAIAVSFGCKSISIYIPMLDMSKQIMWKDMKVDKVFKNKQDDKKIDVVIYYDKRNSKGDIIWLVEKFAKFQVKIGCTTDIPLRLNFQFNVKTNKGNQKIKPK